jgi:hypothetical protein
VTVGLCIPLSLLGNSSVKMFTWLRRIFGGVVFYAVRVVSKASRLLVLRKTSVSQFEVGNSGSLHFSVDIITSTARVLYVRGILYETISNWNIHSTEWWDG